MKLAQEEGAHINVTVVVILREFVTKASKRNIDLGDARGQGTGDSLSPHWGGAKVSKRDTSLGGPEDNIVSSHSLGSLHAVRAADAETNLSFQPAVGSGSSKT